MTQAVKPGSLEAESRRLIAKADAFLERQASRRRGR